MYQPRYEPVQRRFADRPQDLAQLLEMARRHDETIDLSEIVRRVHQIEADLAARDKPVHVEPPPSWDTPILAPENTKGGPGWWAYFGVALLGAFIIGVAVMSAIVRT